MVLNTLATEEDNPLIGELGSRTVGQGDRESLQWLAHFFMKNEKHAQNLEDFDEVKARFMRSPLFFEMTRQSFLDGEAQGRREGEAQGRREGEAQGRREGEAKVGVKAKRRVAVKASATCYSACWSGASAKFQTTCRLVSRRRKAMPCFG